MVPPKNGIFMSRYFIDMTSLHLFNMDKMKNDFQEILQIHLEIKNNKTNIDEKIKQLKELYHDLVKTNTKKIFLFCLDSFYFKYKTLLIELDHLSKFTSLVHNRMYGDYYKLYNIILAQFQESGIEFPGSFSDFTKKYPAYKDLEPFHEYKMTHIIDIHSDILNLINSHYMHYLGKEQNIQSHTTSTRVGSSIISFMQTLEYENTLVREQIAIYVNYLTFFHQTQREYLSKLLDKVGGFQKDIEEEIFIHYHPPIIIDTITAGETVVSEERNSLRISLDSATDIESLIKSSEAEVIETATDVVNESLLTNETVTPELEENIKLEETPST